MLIIGRIPFFGWGKKVEWLCKGSLCIKESSLFLNYIDLNDAK